MTITCVIMAGGKGERFWPKSRTNLPKQFLNISGNKSMIQQSIDRLEKWLPIEQIFVVTNELYAELIHVQIPNLPQSNIIIEPVGRNTAPCVGLASVLIEEKYPDSTMIVIPSDHIIDDAQGFIRRLQTAVEVAQDNGNLVTLGINPSYPETGYGYIECADQTRILNDLEVHRVNKFVEKPDLITAQGYVDSGNFLWNSGMFVWKNSTLQQYIKQLMPEIDDILSTIMAVKDPDGKNNCYSE